MDKMSMIDKDRRHLNTLVFSGISFAFGMLFSHFSTENINEYYKVKTNNTIKIVTRFLVAKGGRYV